MESRRIVGDCREVLAGMVEDGVKVQCVVTSPPYWGLRDYGTGVWEGGDAGCEHKSSASNQRGLANVLCARGADGQMIPSGGKQSGTKSVYSPYRHTCAHCGARRVDRQIGLESTPEAYLTTMVEVFRLVREVLADDGTCWVNMGDSYASEHPRMAYGDQGSRGPGAVDGDRISRSWEAFGLKPKQLVGMPWRLAFALQADGWWLRSDIIWCLSGGNWIYARTAAGAGPVMLKDLVRLKPETVELWTGERWTRVVAWTKRQGRAEAVEIVLRSGERIGCTSNHVWPTQRGNVSTAELGVGDVIQTTRLPTSGQGAGWITPEAFWFAGLYLAEGSRSGETMQISGHVKETARLERIRALVDHYGGSARPYQKGNAQNIHIDSTGLAAVVSTLIAGHTAKDKHLTTAAWQYRDWALGHITAGYLEGDGHQEDDRIRLGFCRNYALERDLRCLGARLGATVVVKPSVAKNQTGSFPAFKGEWRWSRSGHHNERDLGEVVEIRRSRARKFWDVTVADHPHLFALASGVLTHNSKPNPMPESCTDRPTKSHEYLFLLAKRANYFYDAEAVREPHAEPWRGQGEQERNHWSAGDGNRGSEPMVRQYNPSGRNRRTVWTIATEAFPEAHFATFPKKLVEPCILAGTSERGHCPECGARWVRVVETESRKNAPSCNGKYDGIGKHRTVSGGVSNDTRERIDLGFRPTCSHNIEPVPDVVLDPFGGSGTVGAVAAQLGRKFILIDLNPEYEKMQKARTAQTGMAL